PRMACAAPGSSRFEPLTRVAPRYRSSPVCAGRAIKPLGRNPKSTCSLGQDFLASRNRRMAVHPRKTRRKQPLSLSDQPNGISKRNEVLATMFFIGRAKARRHHWAGTPVRHYLKRGERFAKP